MINAEEKVTSELKEALLNLSRSQVANKNIEEITVPSVLAGTQTLSRKVKRNLLRPSGAAQK